MRVVDKVRPQSADLNAESYFPRRFGQGDARGRRSGSRAPRLEFKNEEGSQIVEIALLLPIVLMIVTGLWQLGLVYSDMIALTQAAAAGAQVLQSDRLSTSNDPCADTYNAIVNASPRLVASNISLTISINNHSPVTGNSCSGNQSQLAMGGPVTVQVNYPYRVSIYGISLKTGTMSSGTLSEIEY